MFDSSDDIAKRIAIAAMTFQRECTGVTPESVTALLGGDMIVITFHKALSPAEDMLAKTPEGTAQVYELRKQLFQASVATLHDEINRIVGAEVRESVMTLEPDDGRPMQVLSRGDVMQFFRLKQTVPVKMWNSTAKPSL